MDKCLKCHNKVLPARMPVGSGASSVPCPICGEQNYEFSPNMKLMDAGARTCEYPGGCTADVDTTNGKFCAAHRNHRRMEGKRMKSLMAIEMEGL